VLVVVVDTLRADRLPFYGCEENTAPFLNEWAARSVVFERAWSTSSWTAPASASLFTGVYPHQHGVHLGVKARELLQRGGAKLELDRVPDTLETLPELFQSLGYRTFGVSDNPNVSKAQGFAAGFDHFENFSYAGADRLNAVLASWEDEIAHAAPWFVYLHYMDPHQPYHARQPWHRPPPAKNRHAVNGAAYDSEIGWVDAHLREAFGQLAVDASTLVVFTADHGEEFGDHGGGGHRFKLYSELTRIPMFLHYPGVTPRRVRADVSIVDLLPTLRSILGLPPSEQDAGIDLTRTTGRARDLRLAHDRNRLEARHRSRPVQADPHQTRRKRAVRPGERPGRAEEPRRAAPRVGRGTAPLFRRFPGLGAPLGREPYDGRSQRGRSTSPRRARIRRRRQLTRTSRLPPGPTVGAAAA
jgi:arylsulfatase A-like enzyme